MKLVNLKTMKSKNLSEYEAFKLINETPKEEKLKLGKHELLRTKESVLYKTNKRTRTKWKTPIRRLAALLSKQIGNFVFVNEKLSIIRAGNKIYILADSVRSPAELEFHKNKLNGRDGEVICLRKSAYCKWFHVDYETLKKYYLNEFELPFWFSLKQRSVRSMTQRGFAFNSRRYNDTSKSSATQKFKNDFARLLNDKIYYCISRNLDTILERQGRGVMLKIYYIVFDIDGDCGETEHLIDYNGICINCMMDAERKLEKAKEILKDLPEYKNGIRILLSGGRGFQIFPMNDDAGKMVECNEKRYLEIQNLLNANEPIVDDFTHKSEEGDICMDAFRIMRLPFSASSDSACIVKELPIRRLDVHDKIMEI